MWKTFNKVYQISIYWLHNARKQNFAEKWLGS